eukprot:4850809-Prorocentrum_lima.AAC.1
MTSSLVGSEMCIRDRVRALSWPIVTCCLWLGGSCDSGKISVVWKIPSACLLYTSDAADDM